MKKGENLKKIIYMLLAVIIGISLIGCKDKTSTDEINEEAEYTVVSIEKPDQIQNIRCITFLEDGTLRIGGTDQSGEQQTVWDSKDDGKSWNSAGDIEELGEIEQKDLFYKFSTNKKIYTADENVIRFSENNEAIDLEPNEYYIDSVLSGENLYVLTENEADIKQLWNYNLSNQEWKLIENEKLMKSIKQARGLGCLAINSSNNFLYTEGEGIIKYNIENDEVSTFIKPEELNGYIDTINEPITGLAVKDDSTVICTRDMSGKQSNLYLVTEKKVENKTKEENGDSLEVYSLKENSMIRNSLASFRREYTDISIYYTVGYTGQDGFSVSDAIRKLNTEIMAGEGPDIIVLDNLPVNDYVEKGILESVTDVVENEKDDLFFNMIEGYNSEDEIYAVPTTFRVPIIVGDSTVVDASDMNTMVDLMEKEEAPVLTMQSFPSSVMDMFSTLNIVKDDEIDEKELTDFYENLVRMKELSNITDKVVGDANYSIERAADMFPYGEANVPTSVYFGEAKVGITHIAYGDSFIQLNSAKKQSDIKYDYLNRDEGYYYIPSEILGINSLSKSKNAAKNFLSLYLSEEVQDTNTMGFSINRNSMKNSIAVTEEPQYYSTSYKNMEDSSGLDLYTLSEDEYNDLIHFVEKANTPAQIDAVVMEIVAEQADKILYEGIDVEAAVENVCNKINLYLKE